MKTYTPVLVNRKKPKFSFKTLLLGSSAAKNYYYCARHKTEDIYIMWIESTRVGNTFCFPCVLDEAGDAMVYLTDKNREVRAKSAAMIQRWNLFVKPSSFEEEYSLGELAPKEFHEEYARYKDVATGFILEKELAEARGEEPGEAVAPEAEPEALPEPEAEAESPTAQPEPEQEEA